MVVGAHAQLITRCKHHIETHSAPLTTLFLSIQDAPGTGPADPLGCLYLSIQIENVFLYGRPGRYRPVFYWLKASYFTLKFQARIGPSGQSRTDTCRIKSPLCYHNISKG